MRKIKKKEPRKMGQRVILTSEVYGVSPVNPYIDSEYACGGKVIRVVDPENVDVMWDNGNINSYESCFLSREQEIKEVDEIKPGKLKANISVGKKVLVEKGTELNGHGGYYQTTR